MGEIILFIIVTIVLFIGVSLQKTYNGIPVKELRRRSRQGDPYAKVLYSAVAHGATLDSILWLVIGLSCGVLFFILASQFSWWVAIPVSTGIVWAAFAWVPAGRVTTIGDKLAITISPLLSGLLLKIRPIGVRVGKRLQRLHPVTLHTGLYEKEDIVELLQKQSAQPDNRISNSDLDIAKNALTYSDRIVSEIMTPKSVVKMISVSEPIGPVMMGQLHDSGFSRFPVFDGEESAIVGTLFLKDVLSTKDSKRVKEVMKPEVFYVHAHSPLNQVLDAFIKTKHHMFIVVDEFEETLGIITIEDIIEAILGKQIVDEFDQYDNMRAVASHKATRLRALRKHPAE